MKRTPLQRHTPLARAPMTRKHRPKAETQRIYGDEDRREWVKSLPCCVCGRTPCDNAHTPHPSAGMGRKADASAIVPLCSGPAGCHAELHRVGIKTFGRRHNVDLVRCAERIAATWRARHPMTAVGEVLPAVLPDEVAR